MQGVIKGKRIMNTIGKEGVGSAFPFWGEREVADQNLVLSQRSPVGH